MFLGLYALLFIGKTPPAQAGAMRWLKMLFQEMLISRRPSPATWPTNVSPDTTAATPSGVPV